MSEEKYIIKNAASKYNGKARDYIKNLLVKKRYPTGSIYASKEQFETNGGSIDINLEHFNTTIEDYQKFPKIPKEQVYGSRQKIKH